MARIRKDLSKGRTKLRRLMDARNLTSPALSKLTGVDSGKIARLSSGTKLNGRRILVNPETSWRFVTTIAMVLRVDPEDLFDTEDTILDEG